MPTLTLTPPARDGYVVGSGGLETASFETETTFVVGTNAANAVYRGLLSFDLSGLPAGAVVSSATLRLFVKTRTVDGNTAVAGVYRAATAWPSPATWNNRPAVVGDATFLNIPASPSDGTAVTADVTAHVQTWAQGGQANYGFVLAADFELGPTQFDATYHSLESATAAYRPELVVTYNTPPPAPGAFTSPLAGAVVDASGSVAWGAAADADGDGLTHDADLSLDNGGSWTPVRIKQPGTSFTADYSGVAATTAAKWRVRAWDGTAYGAYTTSDAFTIQHNTAPTAPTPTYPVGNASIDKDALNRFLATFNDANVGDQPSKHDLRYRLTGAAAWQPTVTASNSNRFHDFAAGTFAAGAYEYQWKYYDALGEPSPWSASAFFTAATVPAGPTGLAPTNGSTVGANTGVLAWAADAQDAYEVRKVADDGTGLADTTTVYYTSGVVESATARNHPLTYPVNGRDEHLQVRVRSAGLWSAWSSVRVTVDYTAPATPTVALLVTLDGDIQVTVTNPAPTGTEPAVQSVEVWRRLIGDTGPGIRRAAGVTPNSAWTDHAVANRAAYEFRATAHGANTTSTEGPWTATASSETPDGSTSSVTPTDELIVT